MPSRTQQSSAAARARLVMDAATLQRTMRRMASEIIERCGGATGIALVGIRTGGVYLAQRLQRLIARSEGIEPPIGYADITLYRDDLQHSFVKPQVGPTEINFPVEDYIVILVDDVLFTGRTIRAAMDVVIDLGRPRAIQLAVLVDRGHRELPIHADYAGCRPPTERDETVEVRLREADETVAHDEVVIYPPGARPAAAREPTRPAEAPGPAVAPVIAGAAFPVRARGKAKAASKPRNGRGRGVGTGRRGTV